MFYTLSKRQTIFGFTHRCSDCGKFSWKPDFIDRSGNRIGDLQLSAIQNAVIGAAARAVTGGDAWTRDDVAAIRSQCRKCGARWPTFSVGVEDTAADLVAASAPEPAPPAAYEFELVETHRSVEPIGDEVRMIDNSQSSTTSTRRFEVRKEWTRQVQIETERETAGRAGGGLSFANIAELSLSAERTVRRRYAVQADERQAYVEEISITVPQNLCVEILLHWKRVWQHGVLRAVGDPDAPQVDYRVAVGVTFDQTQRDAMGRPRQA